MKDSLRELMGAGRTPQGVRGLKSVVNAAAKGYTVAPRKGCVD